MSQWFGFFCFLFLSFQALALPIDPSLVDFLNSRDEGATELVILLFKEPSRNEKASRRDLQKRLENNIEKIASRHRPVFAKPMSKLWLVNGVSLEVTRQELQTLITDPSLQAIEAGREKLLEPEPVFLSNLSRITKETYGIQQIGVSELRKQHPELLGQGVRVGVTDTGINANHGTLKNALFDYGDFSPKPQAEPSDPLDHGTHISGTIVGGTHYSDSIGIAPEADLYFARIFDKDRDSDKDKIIEAWQWMVDPDSDPQTDDRVRVVNNSWASGRDYSQLEPQDNIYCRGVKSLYDLGIITVFGAGNTGPNPNTVTIPGACPEAISVGSVDRSDRLMYFSGVGPAQWASATFAKPDVVAPGLDILSASNWGGLSKQTGTSMSAPHATGVVVLLLQRFPDATVDDIKKALNSGAKDLGTAGFDPDFGWGRLDVLTALRQLGELKK